MRDSRSKCDLFNELKWSLIILETYGRAGPFSEPLIISENELTGNAIRLKETMMMNNTSYDNDVEVQWSTELLELKIEREGHVSRLVILNMESELREEVRIIDHLFKLQRRR